MNTEFHKLLERETTQREAKPQEKIRRPRLYKVVLLNDDYTPMDFVTEILQKFFSMEFDKAVMVMWQVHNEGKGVCGVFSRDIAETKVTQVNGYSQSNGHPLKCTMECV